MEKNDLATLKAENDRLMTDLEKLRQRLREEITRTHAGVRLDLNLEKGKPTVCIIAIVNIHKRSPSRRKWSAGGQDARS